MKAKITVKTELEIQLPSLPNFLRASNKDATISIEELSDDQLIELGEKWTGELIRKASRRRKQKTLDMNKRLKTL